VTDDTRRWLTRLAAPAALLAAATIAVVLVREAIHDDPAAGSRATATARSATTTRPAQPPRRTVPARPAFARVGRGDTLESIAERHDTSVETLLELNPTVDPVALTVGQRIRVR
jgi:LysM repeat protein